MEDTFQKEITFVSMVAGHDGEKVTMTEQEVTKTAKFIELSRKDKNQAKLFWRIISLFEGQQVEEGNDNQRIEPSTDKIADLTEKAIRTLLIVDDDFTESDKKEFLSDSIACINFGLWFLNEKCKPFFLKIRPV